MYLTESVHIVYCKAADLCWHADLSAELVHGTDRKTDRQTVGPTDNISHTALNVAVIEYASRARAKDNGR